jgi:hypothetical protein
MFNISCEQGKISRPCCRCNQGIAVSQTLTSILLQKRREVLGYIFVNSDWTVFQQQDLNPTALCRRETGVSQQLFFRNCGEVNPVQGRVENLPHSFEAIQIIDKYVGIDDERAWTSSHLVVPSDIFQKVDGVALVWVSQFVDVGKAWETGFSPHAESSLVRSCGLGKKVIYDGLGDPLLIANTNSWNVSLTNKCTHAVP